MHCLGWCHIVTPDLGKFQKSPKNGEKQEVFLPSLPDGVCFVSKATPNWECSLPHHPITSPLPKNHSKKSTSKRLRWKGVFFQRIVFGKKIQVLGGTCFGRCICSGLAMLYGPFFGGGCSTSPQKVYEEIGFIHQDVLVIFEWDILHFYAKQPMSWVSPPAHDASHHQEWRLIFLGFFRFGDPEFIPGTLNNEFSMDVWWNNQFSYNDLESSNWNNPWKFENPQHLKFRKALVLSGEMIGEALVPCACAFSICSPWSSTFRYPKYFPK